MIRNMRRNNCYAMAGPMIINWRRLSMVLMAMMI